MGFFKSKKPEPELPKISKTEVENFNEGEPQDKYIIPQVKPETETETVVEPQYEQMEVPPIKQKVEKPPYPEMIPATPEQVEEWKQNQNDNFHKNKVMNQTVSNVEELEDNEEGVPEDNYGIEEPNNKPEEYQEESENVSQSYMKNASAESTEKFELTEENAINLFRELSVRIQNLESELFRIKSAFR